MGHVSGVCAAVDAIDFDEVWIMPCGKRLDKEIHTSPEDRKILGKIFVEYLQTILDIPVLLLTTALDDDGKYIHEIILELKSQSKDEIYQLVGIDGYMGIKERTIGPHEKFVVIKRSGYEYPDDLNPNDNLVFLEEVGDISSTKVLDAVKNRDENYRTLVPERVATYIEEKGLYL
jgi:nicotinic acid mononucleotide adenylyltransferase